ncbi:acyl-CoA dehydrogenase family protein [Streptomyces sp. NBC_01235]|uniref:acyl-CoA dehydrogenase family protein n=1 Tax=Streptomyces sp. NBC_01235 TaxID=2903788 RepID=UPI002E0FB986|nr:acyl-CoA dehydrogenase family protein [Streptomyces sp. NBC_01235]
MSTELAALASGLAAAPDIALDAALGDPEDSAGVSAELDEAEEFPAQMCARLDAFGLPAHYVPADHGGALADHEQLLRLQRVVARRDLSAAIAHGKTYLGAAPVWTVGTPRQTAAVSAAVRSGEPFAWALTEPGHGADLANGEVTAARRTGGFLLDGTKWPINNATRADHLVVLARTGDPGTARGHSLFLVDKRRLARGTWRALPKAATHGVRGIDISGIEFSAAELSEAALLGPEGSGLETVLRSLQLTRTMCTALSLGAGEQALRLTAGFTATRLIQRTPLADRPRTRSIVTRCAALLAATEAAASLGARSIHSLTDELSVTSAVVKALAPTLIDAVVADLAELLGLRSFLTGEYAHGAFQKLWRDHHVVAIFDGSTPVNRAALIPQYGRLARGFARADVDTDGLAEAAASGTRPRRLDHRALTLTSRRGCSVVQSLPILAEALADRGAPDGLAEHAAALAATAADIALLMGEARPSARPPMAAYELAGAYELCYAGAACLHLWATGGPSRASGPLWDDGLWARAALRALRARIATVLRTPAPEPEPGDDTIDFRLSAVIGEAVAVGAAVTPFGIPVRTP